MRLDNPIVRTSAAIAAVSVVVAVVAVGGYFVVADDSGALEDAPKPGASDPATGCVPDTLNSPADLGAPKGVVLSPSGEYVAAGFEEVDVLWHNEKPTVLAGDRQNLSISGVSSSGAVVGTNDANTVHTDGRYRDLDGDRAAIVSDVNGSGVIVGSVWGTAAQEEITAETIPLRWDDGEVTELELEPGNRGGAVTVTEDGTVLGFQTDAKQHNEVNATPWMWAPDGENRALPWPSDKAVAVPIDVAGDWVLAQVEKSAVYRWRLSKPDMVEKLAGRMVTGGIDDSGRVYGQVGDKPGYFDGADFVELPGPDGDQNQAVVTGVSTDGSVLAGHTASSILVWSCER